MKESLFIRVLPVVLMLLFLSGCSSSNPVVYPTSGETTESTLFHGHYQFIIDPDTGTVDLVQRDASADITLYCLVRLLSAEWDPVLNLLYATVEIENIVDCIFYGTRLVFDDTGGRWLVNSDGYDYYKINPPEPPSKRMPYICYNRDAYHREFPGLDRREIVFYCPPGANKIDFWIDADEHWERETPIVEDQFCHKTLAISAWAITAFCYDFQSHKIRTPRGDLNEISVWADLSEVGGSSHAEMFDDGMHFDYEAGDFIYGIDFIPDPKVNFALMTIYCEDSDGNISENDVAFIRNYTLRDFPLETVERGLWSELIGPHYEIIRNQTRWEEFWALHKGGPIPPPYVDFTRDMVLVAINGYAGAGEWLEINNAFVNTKHKLQINLSTWNGSKGCYLPYLLTNAYDIVTIEKNSYNADPVIRDRVFYCDEQLPINIVESGKFSKIHSWRTELIETWEDWEDLWEDHTGGTSQPPSIDFHEFTVAAVFLGDREFDDTFVKIDRVMHYQTSLREIYFTEHYPGYGCELAPLDCQPYEIIVFARDAAADYHFFGQSVPDDCV